MNIEQARLEDLQEIRSMVENGGLANEGLEDARHYVIRSDGKIIGSIGLEVWGKQALLRSLIVEEKTRNRGLGSSLVSYVLEVAKRLGLKEVFLLTDDAGEYYLRFGFEYYDRKSVAGDVLKSSEFRGACVETVPVMRLEI